MPKRWTGGGNGPAGGHSADERLGAERRQGADRRSGLDRRGSGASAALSPVPRPYGFREFRERRAAQDRRLYGPDGGASDWHDWRDGDEAAGGTFMALSRAEIESLLSDPED
jgi:hypothetical protein